MTVRPFGGIAIESANVLRIAQPALRPCPEALTGFCPPKTSAAGTNEDLFSFVAGEEVMIQHSVVELRDERVHRTERNDAPEVWADAIECAAQEWLIARCD